MPIPGSAVYSVTPPLKTPSDVTAAMQHQRITVTGASAKLSSFLTGGAYPSSAFYGTKPHGFFIQVESVDAAVKCYLAPFGGTASATNGLELPVAPGGVAYELPDQIAADLPTILSAGTTHCQVIFYW